MQWIDKEIAVRYNLDVKNILPFRDIYILTTLKGKKVLKKSPFSPERIMFIHGAKEHLYQNNFKSLDSFLCTVDGYPYINFQDEIYTLSDYPEGRQCDFDDREDVIKAANLLARLHKASKGYVPPENSKVQDDLGKLPAYFNKRFAELRRLKKIAGKRRSSFDRLFLQHADYFCNRAEKVIEQLGGGEYESAVDAARHEKVFCHHDFTHNNLICSDNRISVINFDYCRYELKVYDVANFIRRKMRKCKWDIEEAGVILKEYLSVEKISREEFFVMKLMLQFPQKFWRVANKYYNSKRNLAEKAFYINLQEAVDEVCYHERFMDRFDLLISKAGCS